MIYLIGYLVIINIGSLFAFRIDKKRAKNGTWRIKESTLLILSLLGGGIGSMFGMSIYRHKTKKMKFRIGVPFLTLVSAVLIWLFIIAFHLI